jgi:membrane-associated phospholipid phosphatase
MVLLAITFIPFPFTGCGTLKHGRGWGQDAIYPIDFKRIPRAAYNAFFDVQTLIPAAGALVFVVDDFDERVSDWASHHTPIFGSREDAKDTGASLRTVLLAETIATALATPSGDSPKKWTYAKLKGVGVELVAAGATAGATGLLKEAITRTRPDESNDKSFPSAHASTAFSYAALANRNLNAIPLPPRVRVPLQVGNILLATSVAWARVEGGKHYPSDVLAGAALGYFLSAFIHDAFLGLPEDMRFGFVIFPWKGGGLARLHFGF